MTIYCITYTEDFKKFKMSYVVECYLDEEKAKEKAREYKGKYDYLKRDYYVEKTEVID